MKTIRQTIENMEFNTTTSDEQKEILIDIAEAEGEYTKTNAEIGKMLDRFKHDVHYTVQKLERRNLIKRRIDYLPNGAVAKRVLSLHPDFLYRVEKEREE